MAKPLRIEYPGAVNHVTTRGNAQQKIYINDADRHHFLVHTVGLGNCSSRFVLILVFKCILRNRAGCTILRCFECGPAALPVCA
jgi:hypothetical protein